MDQRSPIANVDALRLSLRADEELRDLEGCLDAVKLAVEGVWRENHQPWFTDHGPNHSRRTAEYALQLTDLPKLHPSHILTPLEAFILWAAAWLHDVGMQYLLAVDAPSGELSSDDFAHVRHQHPNSSSERILQEWGRLGLPDEDDALAEVVAGVARAHGTQFYVETIGSVLAGEIRVRNRPVRARLLAALLLFADELDLHYERAPRPSGWAVDNAVSQAHKFKHQSVRSVRPVCGEDGRIAVELELVFHSDLPDRDALAVQRWIEVKLRQQMSMIAPEVDEGFGGQAHLDRVVHTAVSKLRAQKDLPSSAALSIIRAETARGELINHDTDFEKVREAIREGGIVLLNDGSLPTEFDDSGARDLVEAACADAASDGFSVCLSRRARLSLSATAADIVGEWAAALGEKEPGGGADEVASRAACLATLLGAVSSRPLGKYLFAIDLAQAMDEESLRWLAHSAVPSLRAATNAAFLLTAAETTSFAVPGDMVTAISMSETQQAASAAYLGRYVDRGVALAESRSLPTYGLVKRTAQYHELELRGES